MIRLVGFLVLVVITAGGYMYLDYRMASRWARSGDADGLTVGEYLGGLSGRISGLTGSASASGLPTRVADMLPKPPEGWTVRASVPEDVAAFLPKAEGKADRKALDYVKAVGLVEQASGMEAVALTYEKGDRKVLVKAVRYPNIIFTSATAVQQKFDLQMRGAAFRGTEFATVRGLDVTEDLLPEGFRGRFFLAKVGAQIHLQVLVPKRMSDKDLVPFLQTLHVQAMNESVIDTREGLGEVPVIVLASALDDAARAAYVAGVAEREAEEASRGQAALKEAEAKATEEAAPQEDGGGGFLDGLVGGEEQAAPEAAAKPTPRKSECTTGNNGVKRCSVGGAEAAEE